MSLHEQAQNVSRIQQRGMQQVNYAGLQELQSLYKKKAELDMYILYKEKQLNYPYYNYGLPSASHVPQQINPQMMNHAQMHHMVMQMQANSMQAQTTPLPPLQPPPLQPQQVQVEQNHQECVQDQGDKVEMPNDVDIVMDDTYTREVSYAQALMKNVEETDGKALEEINYTPLFQKQCTLCWDKKKLDTCKNHFKAHVGDLNWDFASLPYINRCLRSHCLDMNCKRYHHALTKRISTRCKNKNCNCPNYVHPHDKPENKPYFWKSYEDSIDKPSKEIIDSYFLLKKKT